MASELMSDEEVARLLLSHGRDLFRVAHEVLGDCHLAEEAVAETYLRAWANRQALRDRRRLGAWLHTICRRQALNLRRRTRRTHPLNESMASCAPEWDEQAYRADLLGRLPEHLRVHAEMVFVEGRTYAEVASITGLPLSTVRGRISLSRDRLRKEIRMSTEPTMHGKPATAKKLRSSRGLLSWRGCKIRFLGVCWTGSKTLYRASGARLSRPPVAIKRSQLLDGSPFVHGMREGPTLSLFWQLSGSEHCTMGCNARGARSGVPCQPCDAADERVGNVRLRRFRCPPPPQSDDAVWLLGGVMGEEDRAPGRSFRFEIRPDMLASEFVCTSKAGWGALHVFPPVSGPRDDTSMLFVAFSSAVAESGCSIFGLDRSGAEVRPVAMSIGGSSCAEGHLHGAECDLEIPAHELSGVAIYPRHRASVEWGKVRVPPKPRSLRSG